MAELNSKKNTYSLKIMKNNEREKDLEKSLEDVCNLLRSEEES